MGFGVCGLGFRVWGLGFGVWGLGFRVWGLGFSFNLPGFLGYFRSFFVKFWGGVLRGCIGVVVSMSVEFCGGHINRMGIFF